MKTRISTLLAALTVAAPIATAQNQTFASINSGSVRPPSALKGADDDEKAPPAKKPAAKPEAAAADTAMKNAIGALSAQGLILQYFSVATLSDAYVKKAYSKKECAEILGRYEGMLKGITKTLQDLPEKAGFDESDSGYVKALLKGYNAVGEMIAAFNAFMDDGAEKNAQKFEAARQKAQKVMDEMFNTKEE